MSDSLMQLTREGDVEILRLTLPEQLESLEFNTLNESLRAAIEADRSGKWILDLSGVDYAGSSVLGLIVNIRQWIKQGGGQLVLCGMSTRLTDIFRACSLERLFTITRTRADAIRRTTT